MALWTLLMFLMPSLQPVCVAMSPSSPMACSMTLAQARETEHCHEAKHDTSAVRSESEDATSRVLCTVEQAMPCCQFPLKNAPLRTATVVVATTQRTPEPVDVVTLPVKPSLEFDVNAGQTEAAAYRYTQELRPASIDHPPTSGRAPPVV